MMRRARVDRGPLPRTRRSCGAGQWLRRVGSGAACCERSSAICRAWRLAGRSAGSSDTHDLLGSVGSSSSHTHSLRRR
eukprot:7061064-Prymnesium_polylepis.1